MQNFGTLQQFLNFCPPQYVIVQGVWGGPRLIFLIGILIFMLLRSPCKLSEPYGNPFLGFESSYFCYIGAHAKFQNPTTIFEFLSPQICHSAGSKGGPQIFVWIGILIFK